MELSDLKRINVESYARRYMSSENVYILMGMINNYVEQRVAEAIRDINVGNIKDGYI